MAGVAYLDASLRELSVSEFVDNDQLSNLEVRCLLQVLFQESSIAI